MHCTGVQDAFRGFVVPPWDAWRTRLVRARVLPVDGVAKCLSRLERWSRGRSDGDVISPVRGFLPRRAGRCLAVNVPKPAMVTGSPRARASPMAVIMAPITRSAADLGKDICPATSAASSDRFQARVVRHLYAVLRRRQQRRSRSTRSSASTSARTCIYGHLAECNANAPAVSHLEMDDNVSGREHEVGQPRHARSVMCALAL